MPRHIIQVLTDNVMLRHIIQVLADGHDDIEAPEYLSSQHQLYVYAALPVSSGGLSSPVTVTISLLVHVRYHRPSPDPKVSHVPVIMHHPRVLLNCSRKSKLVRHVAVSEQQC